MPRVTVELPGMLSDLTGVPRSVPVDADRLDGALRALLARHPVLEVHLFDETTGLRPHVLCFHNETNTRWLASMAAPLADGDTITILQAVSGG